MAPRSGAEGGRRGVARLYLLAYNTAQAIGWTALLVCTVKYLCSHQSYVGLYAEVEGLLKIFQTLAVLEVVHCALGLVQSSVLLTAFQVSSRVFLVWGIVDAVREAQDSQGVPLLLVAWTVTEVVRYSFYAAGLLELTAYPLLWLRYTLFLGLYPLGVTGELLAIYSSLEPVKRARMYSIALPNRANCAFDYYYFLIIVMINYVPIFPQLFGHMLAQRRKLIGGNAGKKSA